MFEGDLCLRGVCVWPLFRIAVIGVLSRFAIISLKRERADCFT